MMISERAYRDGQRKIFDKIGHVSYHYSRISSAQKKNTKRCRDNTGTTILPSSLIMPSPDHKKRKKEPDNIAEAKYASQQTLDANNMRRAQQQSIFEEEMRKAMIASMHQSYPSTFIPNTHYIQQQTMPPF